MSSWLSVVFHVHDLTLSCGINSLMHPNLSHQTCCCGHWICWAVPGRFTPQLSLTSGFKRDMTNYPHWILLFAVTGFAGRFRADLHCKLNPTSSWPFSSLSNCHAHVQVFMFRFMSSFKSCFMSNRVKLMSIFRFKS